MPVVRTTYLICLTCEVAGDMRTRKTRAMLIRKELLASPPEAAPAFEAPSHSTRWKTLKQLAASYVSAPFKFLEVEICLPDLQQAKRLSPAAELSPNATDEAD